MIGVFIISKFYTSVSLSLSVALTFKWRFTFFFSSDFFYLVNYNNCLKICYKDGLIIIFVNKQSEKKQLNFF